MGERVTTLSIGCCMVDLPSSSASTIKVLQKKWSLCEVFLRWVTMIFFWFLQNRNKALAEFLKCSYCVILFENGQHTKPIHRENELKAQEKSILHKE